MDEIEKQFWSKVDIKGDNECWEWTGRKNTQGYGAFFINGRKDIRAHRYAWEITNGEIPAKLIMRHLCNNPSCVNPSHLSLGTHKDNSADTIAAGRSVKGRTPRRLKRGESTFIYRLHAIVGVPQEDLARQYKLSRNYISILVSRERRKEIAAGPQVK